MALNPPHFALGGENRFWEPAGGRKYPCSSCFFPFFSQGLSLRGNSTTVAASKKENKNTSSKRKKDDAYSFVLKPDEATGPFPEAVLLKQKNIEDGRLMPEFADVEERELFEFLNLKLETDTEVGQMRHYEVVYLIHEKHNEEVENVSLKVQEFLKEKKGRMWRFSDWGMRKLAYKIKKAKNAHYILMNFELEAEWINDFKRMLDRDERIIRHLVMKRDKAETADCPPPPEFQSLRSDMNDEEDDIDN
ncbi:REGULATOR OF FATTY-ACID COMPOSITION 3 family protein [Dorcoceras hygrometricum]|uniref:REGULATOR OF FATTY-ACID COMPOSITION 3 family protein n=1 Tax=Dorcoceras hygrometricum TaxID=472368 RepID=A0A2Z7DHM3_9LAMI|nr:REGULATOR OF FATTY-ACID COMPOSITION 3 family protein [Dorcoceras hygrometricum]